MPETSRSAAETTRLTPEAVLAFRPPIAHTAEELGIPWALVMDIALRRISLEGLSSLTSLSSMLKLSVAAAGDIFQHFRQQQLIEVKGMIGEDYSFSLTAAGRQLANERFQVCQYSGPVPVSLRDYHHAVVAQSARVKVNRRSLAEALSDLVLSDDFLSQLGPAIVSQRSIFLHGPTGNGKTSIAERLLRVYHDLIVIPHAVEVDGQIIILHDPVAHQSVETDDPGLDSRWVVCRRPCVAVGGELTSSMLELRLDEASKTYAAPIQMKSNNGILFVDDFGRQAMSPRELLNRWIVPLDSRVDYLSLRYGVKFQIPFESMVVFATNLHPRDLADDAFLRRIHSKVYVEPVSPEVFDEIFRRVASTRNLPCSPGASATLRQLCMDAGCTELRACYPSDICEIISWMSEFEETPLAVDPATLERATRLYFAREHLA